MGEMKKNTKLTDCAMKLHKNDAAYKSADTQDFIITLIMVIIAVFAFRAFIFEPTRVSGESMMPTLQNNERMFVEKFTYWFDAPSRGDIVICKYPPTFKRGTQKDSYVKRVVALPGETVRVHDGSVYIKGVGEKDFHKLDETSYLGNLYIFGEYGDTVVPQGYVFVMGDNRNDSADSRDPSVGPIKMSQIVGRVHGVVFPFSHIRDLEGVDYGQ